MFRKHMMYCSVFRVPASTSQLVYIIISFIDCQQLFLRFLAATFLLSAGIIISHSFPSVNLFLLFFFSALSCFLFPLALPASFSGSLLPSARSFCAFPRCPASLRSVRIPLLPRFFPSCLFRCFFFPYLSFGLQKAQPVVSIRYHSLSSAAKLYFDSFINEK